MRNLIVDTIAGLLITMLAVYDFGTPECYVLIAFSSLVLIWEVYTIYRVKTGKGKPSDVYRPKSVDWYDLFLGIILFTCFYQWLGTKSHWLIASTLLCLLISVNAVYNLLHRHGNSNKENKSAKGVFMSKLLWLDTLLDLIRL